MGLYNKYILPKVINWSCSQNPTMRQREKVIPLARGNVLEIGIGSGLNLPFYNKDKIKHLTGIDPSIDVWNKNIVDTGSLPFEFMFINASAEDIPADDDSFDTVVMTYALCTIPNTGRALTEIKRVLKSNGRLLFSEHGKAPDEATIKWQNIINPMWRPIGGGCNLNRDISAIIEENGFNISKLDTMYLPGWKIANFNYWGSAEPK